MKNAARPRPSRWFALLVLLLLAGCGGQEDAGTGDAAVPDQTASPAAAADDEAAIADVVTTYLNALADRDFATACEQLSPRA